MKTLQQFFTHRYNILKPFIDSFKIKSGIWVDPYAGEGHLLKIVDGEKISIDIDKKLNPNILADSFTNLPKFASKISIITNPPYAHRHVLQKSNTKLYDTIVKAGFVDLYEYSIQRLIDQLEYIPHMFIILPENFIASRTTKLRSKLFKMIKGIQVHTKSLCDNTDQPTVCVYISPNNVSSSDLWIDDTRSDSVIIKSDGMRPSIPSHKNLVDFGHKKWQNTNNKDTSILLQAIDGGSYNNRIRLMRVWEKWPREKWFINKISDRAYIQIIPKFFMQEEQILYLIQEFNKRIDKWRLATNGLGLTSFRSNTKSGFRRKRIDFKLARQIINDIIASGQIFR